MVEYEIVEYAHIIGKSTDKFTFSDMMNFYSWWKGGASKIVVIKGNANCTEIFKGNCLENIPNLQFRKR
jgi:hypothetical protein